MDENVVQGKHKSELWTVLEGMESFLIRVILNLTFLFGHPGYDFINTWITKRFWFGDNNARQI